MIDAALGGLDQQTRRALARVGVSAEQQIVNKAWNFAHILRDDWLSYMAYTEQITRYPFDPARAKDDKYYRVHRQMKFGAYTASFESGIKFRIDGMVADDIGIKPSKLQFSQLMAIAASAPPPGTTPNRT